MSNDEVNASCRRKSSKTSKVTDKAKEKSIPTSTGSLPSSSLCHNRSKRIPRTKFVGRRISHQREDQTKSKKWYFGTVTGTLSGNDGAPTTEYEVLYDGEQDPWCVKGLLQDYRSSSLKFIDV
ncbi:uncharacterized protein LOC117319515 [Pecten maximus]|uniref:uncharacterized protein LOC117319515 n=1 Tax=Pecten maximus TaxID=6579 RepID=UPI00145889F3|nr:uncharacterized protein LOC117319515 [Pecten maximus]